MIFAQKFLAGFVSPFIGAMLIVKHQTLRRLAFLPFILTAIIFVFGLALGLPFVTSLVSPFASWIAAAIGLRNEVLTFLIPLFLWPALALMLVYFLLIFTRLIASPLYSLLAERVLMKQGVLLDQKISVLDWSRRRFRLTGAALVKAMVLFSLGLVLGALSFIPGLGLFTGFAFLLLLSYDVVDYALEAMAWTFNQRIDFFRQHFAVFLGLGTSLGLVFLVPGLNFFVLPASVAGASNLVRRMIRD